MDNNPKNNEFENDIDETLKIFKKNHDSRSAEVPSENEKTIVDFDRVKKQPEEPDATRINMEPVKQEKKTELASTAKKQEAEVSPSPACALSLDDFNAEDNSAKQKKTNKTRVTFLGSVHFGIIKLVLYIAFVALSSYFLSTAIINVGNDVFAFVKEDREIIVNIPEGADTGDIAEILYDAGVIEHPTIFKMYAKFRISKRSYLTGEYLSGEQTVNPMMNFDTLINTLADYERSVSGTVRITIPEGLTVDETIDLLVSKGVGKKEDYTEALQEFAYDYKFATPLTKENISEYRFDTNYSYRLEGYLFPDTYDFYLNENPISALDKFLVNFNRKFEEEFYQQCEKKGMTVDEVITLASMIEKEGNNAADYYYISSVFHNRLKNSASFPYLNSDASLQYALQEREGLYGLDTTLDHPYNTYKYKGLPPGPICNPGIEAIYAALYPESTSYYYFYTKKNGTTVYSRTYEEHQRYVNADKNS